MCVLLLSTNINHHYIHTYIHCILHRYIVMNAFFVKITDYSFSLVVVVGIGVVAAAA